MPNLVSLTYPSPKIVGKTQRRVFKFSGFLVKSLVNKNCHNPKTCHDIDMKLRPVTKLDKGKNFEDDIVSANYHIIVFFPIDG